MNNYTGKKADRSEEIAFLVTEAVLGVRIELADANGTNGSVDGRWRQGDHVGIIEVTGPPAEVEMRDYAIASRRGEPYMEVGSGDAHLGTLAEYLSAQLEEPWAVANIDKLRRTEADERHLYLIGRTFQVQEYYARLSDTYTGGPIENINRLAIPDEITAIWYPGRATRGATRDSPTIQWIARFDRSAGWSTHKVEIDERSLPAPPFGKDRAPAGWRKAQRDRTSRG
ncbi:hypothetical protein [Cellulosimicrobium cellulans]|uniref:hypothetical protein n=1 Tax=Cellulosimicrobium cellulans TaxID=1710 RepID=UPI001BABC16E|nr:hypothetical protein [Cellulosimicrobium cellulans]QUB99632.1 hypothetical protein J5A69_18490 [Cellulosimicrobium cellulans]